MKNTFLYFVLFISIMGYEKIVAQTVGNFIHIKNDATENGGERIDSGDTNEDNKTKNNTAANCDVKIFGTGGANTSLDDLSKGGGNLAIGAMLKFGKKENAWNELYAMYNTQAANSADTSVFAKTFLFPQIGKRLVTIGISRVFVKSDFYRIVPFVDASYNKLKYSNDTFEASFYTITPTFGCRIEFFKEDVKFGDDEVPFCLTFVPYYNIISVDPKYFFDKNDVYNRSLSTSAIPLADQHLPPSLHTMGLEVSMRISSFQIFANMKWVINDKVISPFNTELRGGNIILGATINTDIINF